MMNVTEIKMKKGQELLEHFAVARYGKKIEELAEEEKNTLKGSKVKAICSIVLNDYLKIDDVMLVQGPDKMFVGMPTRRLPDGNLKDIVQPITINFRDYIKEKIIELYNSELSYNIDLSSYSEELKVTDIKLKRINGETALKASISVAIEDSLVIRDIKIIETSNGLAVVMPCKKGKQGNFEDIVQFKEKEKMELEEIILKEYDKFLEDINELESQSKNNVNGNTEQINSSKIEPLITVPKTVSEVELTEQDKKRIEKNINILKENGIPYMEKMVNIPTEKNIRIESKENIYIKLLFDYANATIATTILNRNGNYEGVYDMVMGNLQKKHQILDRLPNDLKEILLQYKNGTYNAESLNAITWKYEECVVNMWALGLISKPGNKTQCDVDEMNDILYYIDDCNNFIDKCTLKSKEEILEYADMLYRLNWACEEVRLQGGKLESVNGVIVYYQRKAINWIMFLE